MWKQPEDPSLNPSSVSLGVAQPTLSAQVPHYSWRGASMTPPDISFCDDLAQHHGHARTPPPCYLLALVIFWCQPEHGNLHIWLCTLVHTGAYCEMTKVPIVEAPG